MEFIICIFMALYSLGRNSWGWSLTAIVTASIGIGTETVRVLALRGVHVPMGIRSMASGKEFKEAIVKEIPSAKIEAMGLDLSLLASVRAIRLFICSFLGHIYSAQSPQG